MQQCYTFNMNDETLIIILFTLSCLLLILSFYLSYKNSLRKTSTFILSANSGHSYKYIVGNNIRYGMHGVMIKLPFKLPSLYADTLSSNKHEQQGTILTLLNATKLSLEGDFDSSFQLFCVNDNEREVLRLLTPDIMSSLLEIVHSYDVMILNNELWILRNKRFIKNNYKDKELLKMAINLCKLLDNKSKLKFNESALAAISFNQIQAYRLFGIYVPKDTFIIGLICLIFALLGWFIIFVNRALREYYYLTIFLFFVFPVVPYIFNAFYHSKNRS
jgi:hypothetical protein